MQAHERITAAIGAALAAAGLLETVSFPFVAAAEI